MSLLVEETDLLLAFTEVIPTIVMPYTFNPLCLLTVIIDNIKYIIKYISNLCSRV